jgi:hypothetical protein
VSKHRVAHLTPYARKPALNTQQARDSNTKGSCNIRHLLRRPNLKSRYQKGFSSLFHPENIITHISASNARQITLFHHRTRRKMSRYFPHPQYAEDQRLSHTILITHCLHRGFAAGGVIGASIGATRSLLSKSSPHKLTLSISVLRGAGTGALIGTGLLAVGVTARMWGREEIEWKDRAWRLCENEGQKNTDDGSLVGIAVALAAGGMAKGARVVGWRGLVGGAAVGSLVGSGLFIGFKALGGKKGAVS